MLIERIDQRVLGAIQIIDRVTQTPVRRSLRIESDKARLVRNLHGLYVVTDADGMASYTEAFSHPPDSPSLGANQYNFIIEDRQKKRYLPRLVSLRLPRDHNPANAGNQDSLFTPIDVQVYPASTAALSPNWSTIRVSVTQGPNPNTASPVRGSLIRIINPVDTTLLASGISDDRGEALVIVPGVPVTKFAENEHDGESGSDSEAGGESEDPVVVNTIQVRLEVSFKTDKQWPVDPDLLEQEHAANIKKTMNLTLSTGRMEKAVINLT